MAAVLTSTLQGPSDFSIASDAAVTLSALVVSQRDDEMAIAQLAQLRLRRFKPAFVAIDRRDAGAGAGKTDGRGAADAAAPARHHADAARQAKPIRRILSRSCAITLSW